MALINEELLDRVTGEAKRSPRLRMNYNFHETLDAKAQRLLNALEPGTVLPVHRHCQTAETYLVLRGVIKVLFYDDRKRLLKSGTVIFEVKDGPYQPLGKDDILE